MGLLTFLYFSEFDFVNANLQNYMTRLNSQNLIPMKFESP